MAVKAQIDQFAAKGNHKEVIFWCRASCKVRPEAYSYAITLADALSIDGQHKEGADLFKDILEVEQIYFFNAS